MKTISIPLGKRSYPVWVQQGLFNKITDLLKPMNMGNKWFIITQDKIKTLYGNELQKKLKNSGFNVKILSIPNGEKTKSLKEFENLHQQLLKFNCDRKSILLALGGGVVGDITGFVASTFMRGIEYIQIPTTLLAMIDSSIGGKTGVNLNLGKNLIGAFHQPRAVIIDPEFVSTLPHREIISAFGEMIKYGVIADVLFFKWLDKNLLSLISNKDITLLEKAIIKSVDIKAKIVAEDEMENGIRKFLNFGHTIGHALETVLDYGTLVHGEAVSYGMISAGYLSTQKTNLTNKDYLRLKSAINKLSLPRLNGLNNKTIIQIIKQDKKAINGKINFVLLQEIGKPIIVDTIDEGIIKSSLGKL